MPKVLTKPKQKFWFSLSYLLATLLRLMAYPLEDLEQQRRSVAMARPGTSVQVRMTLEREVALSVLTLAAELTRLSIQDKREEGVA